jgi:hypothetical protein
MATGAKANAGNAAGVVTYGSQQVSFFNAHYDCWCYLPTLCAQPSRESNGSRLISSEEH